MKKSALKMKIIVLILINIIIFSSGCKKNNNYESKSDVSGLITIAGSTALQPLVESAGKKFSEKYTDVIINVQGGGSGTGLTQVIQGAVDIGNSDIDAEDKLKPEFANQLVDHKICVVGFGIVVNNKVQIDNISSSDLIKIFTGKVTNWKEVGGNDLPIVVINRPKSSGTRAAFKKYALNGEDEIQGKVLTQDSSGAVQKTIESNDGAIGYLASSFLKTISKESNIKILKVDGVDMNKENIANGKYKIWSYEHMYTKGDPKGVTKMFLDYMITPEVSVLVENLGYIPIKDMKVTRK